MKRFALLITLTVYGFWLTGQTNPDDSVQFEMYLDKALSSQDSASVYYKKAENLVTSDYQQIALTRSRALYQYFRGEMDSSEIKLRPNILLEVRDDFSVATKVELARSYYLQDFIVKRRGDYRDGIEYLMKAVQFLERDSIVHDVRANCYQNLGVNYRLLGDYESAVRWQKTALEFAIKYDFYQHQVQAYGNLGLLYMEQNKLSLAKEHNQFVVHLINARPDLLSRGEQIKATIYNNIALLFETENNFDSAIHYYMKSMSYWKQVQPRETQLEHFYAISQIDLAEALYRTNNFDEALKYASESLDRFREVFGDYHRNLLVPLRINANILYDLGRKNESRTLLMEALQTSKTTGIELPITYNHLANQYLWEKELETARTYFDSAISTNSREINNQTEYDNYKEIFISLKGMIEIESLSADTPDGIQDLHLEMNGILRNFFSLLEGPSIREEAPDALEIIYRIYLNEYQKSGDRKWLNEIWGISETIKAVKLRTQLDDTYSLRYSLPPEMLERETELKDSIVQVTSAVTPGSFDSTLFILNRKYENLIATLEEDYPEYYALKYQNESTSLESRQAQLEDGEMLLNFFQGGDNVYVIRLSRDTVILGQVARNTLEGWVDEMNNSILGDGSPVTAERYREIRTACLLQSDLDSTRHVYVIPDGIIWKLNFAALTDPGDEEAFLGNTRTFSFQYYAGDRRKGGSAPANKVLAFSFSEDVESESSYSHFRDLDTNLPGTSKEINSISKLWDGDYYYANQASETIFKSKGGDYGLLHLAVHGFQDEYFPENSFLQFSSGDSLNDGRLYAYELYNLRLNAKLAVLSACDSGDGKIETGEGMMSLARSFAYAGVESLLASRWPVPDVSAPFLMKYFYEGLNQGMRKSESLRYAQVKFLENDADNLTSDPLYWAGFYVIGNDDPVVQSGAFFKKYLWVVLPIVLLGLLLRRRKRS